jgi:SAM-dependent methyltransferase
MELSFQGLFALGMKRHLPELLLMPEGTIINLGPGYSPIPGTIGHDLPAYNAEVNSLPYTDGSVSGIHCYHFLEHISDPVRVLRDMQRVLAPGGVVNIVVPYYSANIASTDLDHKHFFSEKTFPNLFNNTGYAKNHDGWKLSVHFSLIAAIVERNLCLFVQLVREP